MKPHSDGCSIRPGCSVATADAVVTGRGSRGSSSYRRAFATAEEAVAFAQREAADGCPRAVWFVRGGRGGGVIVPDRYVVGLADTRCPPVNTPRESWHIVRSRP